MKQSFVIHAETRSLQGKGASRRLRREGKVPAILYGGLGEAVKIAADANELSKHVKNRAFFSQLLDLELDGKSEQVVIKDLQRHPARDILLHLDLQRVRADVALRSHVQLKFVGADVCPGVKTNGGVFDRVLVQIEIECLPKDLPASVTVDVSSMDVGDAIRVSQITLPEGVKSVALMHGRDPTLATVQLPRAAIEEEAQEAAEAAAAAAAAPAGADAKAPGAEAGGDAAKADASKPAANAKPAAKK